MQIVILAGGLATRLRPMTNDIPKSMIQVENKPFLQHQIELLRQNEVSDIVLCVGHLSHMIKDYFGDGKRFGVRIRYSDEGENLLGTGGALKKAEPLLEDEFFLMYGDSYLLLNYRSVESYYEKFERFCLLVVYKNYNLYDNSNVGIKDGLISVYDKNNPLGQLTYIDVGLSILRKGVLNQISSVTPSPLEELYQKIIAKKEMLAYVVNQRFYEIGSFQGLKEFENLIKGRKELVR